MPHAHLELGPASELQTDLWTAPDSLRSRTLMRTIDGINATWGRDTVTFAGSGIKRGWRLHSEQRSPRYMTCWDELLKVA